mmetsp:Transcript_21419/g.44025  ORF Transcript_21419/g.44025 Transcript_21419/m.44025 type:complete len:350 (-) Transcript_21419:867-1916(-)
MRSKKLGIQRMLPQLLRQFRNALTRRLSHGMIIRIAHYCVVPTKGCGIPGHGAHPTSSHRCRRRVFLSFPRLLLLLEHGLPRILTVKLDTLSDVKSIETHPRQQHGDQIPRRRFKHRHIFLLLFLFLVDLLTISHCGLFPPPINSHQRPHIPPAQHTPRHPDLTPIVRQRPLQRLLQHPTKQGIALHEQILQIVPSLAGRVTTRTHARFDENSEDRGAGGANVSVDVDDAAVLKSGEEPFAVAVAVAGFEQVCLLQQIRPAADGSVLSFLFVVFPHKAIAHAPIDVTGQRMQIGLQGPPPGGIVQGPIGGGAGIVFPGRFLHGEVGAEGGEDGSVDLASAFLGVDDGCF